MSLGHVLGDVEKAKLIITSKGGGAPTSTFGALSNGGGGISPANLTSTMNVQYNPSSLTIQANAEPVSFAALHQSSTTGVVHQNTRPPQISLTVDLIFDAMNPKDAFMAERFNVGVGDIVNLVKLRKIMARGGYTVQLETSALMAATMQKDIESVTFAWADMSFKGRLTEIQSQYTMFSVSGKPIRSKVSLRICQDIKDASESAWRDAFEKKFMDKETFSMLSGMQNLINI